MGLKRIATVLTGAGTANATTSSTTVVAADDNRNELIITNDSDTVVYLGLTDAAVLHKGIRLNANGGEFHTSGPRVYQGLVTAIHGGTGNKVLCYVQF